MQAAVFSQDGPTAGALLRTTFALTRQCFAPFALISLVGIAPFVLLFIGSATITRPDQLGMAVLLMMFAMLFWCISAPTAYGAIMVAVFRAAMGQPVDVSHCLRTGFRRLPRMLGAGILYMLAMMIGFVLLIIPGIIACYTFLLAIPVVMLEDKGPVEAMRRSRYLTEGFRLSAFGAMLVIVLLSLPLSMIGLLFVNNIAVYLVFSLGANLITTMLSFVLVGVYYFGVRSYKESLGVDEVAAVFD